MKDKIKSLIKLMEENPELEVLCKVEDDLFCGMEDDRYTWFLGEIGNCEISDYYMPFERIYIDDEIYEKIYEELEDNYDLENLSDEEIELKVDIAYEEKKAANEIKTAIFVNIVV
jgi:hypothetical protein